MKFKNLLSLAIFTLILSLPFSAMAMEGEGTKESPYLITNQTELKKVSSFPYSHFRLENDIVLEGEWVPICGSTEFRGTFDGNGYTVSNLTVSTSGQYAGLFGINSGRISNLKIITSDNGITSKYITVTDRYTYVGGVCGYNSLSSTIDSCSVDGKLFGYSLSFVGGIAGYSEGRITNCCSSGNIDAMSSKTYSTGISYTFADYTHGTISDCYSDASITGYYTNGIGPYASNCYYAGTSSNMSSQIGGFASLCVYDMTTDSMKKKKTYTDLGWDFENVWGIDANINDGYPYLLWEYQKKGTASAEIIGASSTDSTLKFISAVSVEGEPDIKAFGTTFIPLWLFESASADVATVEYDNSNYNITNNQTYGATLTDIPESCKDMDIVGKSYVKDADGNYIWSAAKYSSVASPMLNSVE